jgi:hypothetical protein
MNRSFLKSLGPSPTLGEGTSDSYFFADPYCFFRSLDTLKSDTDIRFSSDSNLIRDYSRDAWDVVVLSFFRSRGGFFERREGGAQAFPSFRSHSRPVGFQGLQVFQDVQMFKSRIADRGTVDPQFSQVG